MTKITPTDTAYSWCVRERVNWVCERCGTEYHPPTTGLQCSHFFSRTNKALRCIGDNTFAHCAGCHSFLGDNPHIFTEWVKAKYGDERYNKLVRASNNIVVGKRYVRNEKEIAKHYRSELERLLELRSQGVTGRIEFTDWTEVI